MIPDVPVAPPPKVRALARGARLEAVWRNALGGIAFRATAEDGSVSYVKYGPRNDETTAEDEARRLAWAAPFTPVPRVLEVGGDDEHEWIVTRAVAGSTAVAPRWIADADTAVRSVGKGLRALHEALPVAECPFRWDVPSRIENAALRGIDVPASLRTPPPIDVLVVCHGDPCAPNTLLDDDGRWSAHVDLGALGVADRWADIAVAALSTEWNWGPGWQRTLIEAYGVPFDEERVSYYQELWNAT